MEPPNKGGNYISYVNVVHGCLVLREFGPWRVIRITKGVWYHTVRISHWIKRECIEKIRQEKPKRKRCTTYERTRNEVTCQRGARQHRARTSRANAPARQRPGEPPPPVTVVRRDVNMCDRMVRGDRDGARDRGCRLAVSHRGVELQGFVYKTAGLETVSRRRGHVSDDGCSAS